ncbi:MAG: dihydrolipoamide acetyltransferase family protein [Chthoniobacterales bacterium]
MGEFRMPSLGADMRAAILMHWHVKPGDKVKRGDIIADVETDKGLIEIEVFEHGVVDQILAEPGKKLPVGTVLATIRGEGEPAAPAIVTTPTVAALPEAVPKAKPPIRAAPIPHVRASPLARKTALELDVDLSKVTGTGAGGVIEHADVLRADAMMKEEKPLAPAEKFRRAIAAAMSRSNREIPHYYLATEIDMTHSLGWLTTQNAKRSLKDRLLVAVLLIKAVARALHDVPELNGYWIDDQLQKKDAVHVGFAIALRQFGLIAPAIHDVHVKTLDELMAAIHDLVPRARSGRLRSSELTDATITVTSLGDLGVKTLFGVIYPPQVALVGFGKIADQPWAEGGTAVVRPILTATLSADHRATDGLRGAQFLEALNNHLQAPEKL